MDVHARESGSPMRSISVAPTYESRTGDSLRPAEAGVRSILRSSLAAVVLGAMLLGGCRHHRAAGDQPRSPKSVATAADLERLGTRHYTERSADEVSAAAVGALKLLGYEVVMTSPRIRTAPRDVGATAVRGNTTAQLYVEAVAWDVDVRADPQGVTLVAMPRATVNGEPMTQVYIGWAEKNYGQLMQEIDASLPQKRLAP